MRSSSDITREDLPDLGDVKTRFTQKSPASALDRFLFWLGAFPPAVLSYVNIFSASLSSRNEFDEFVGILISKFSYCRRVRAYLHILTQYSATPNIN